MMKEQKSLSDLSQEEILDVLDAALKSDLEYLDQITSAVQAGMPLSELEPALQRLSEYLEAQRTIVAFLKDPGDTRCQYGLVWCACGHKDEFELPHHAV